MPNQETADKYLCLPATISKRRPSVKQNPQAHVFPMILRIVRIIRTRRVWFDLGFFQYSYLYYFVLITYTFSTHYFSFHIFSVPTQYHCIVSLLCVVPVACRFFYYSQNKFLPFCLYTYGNYNLQAIFLQEKVLWY